MAGSLQNIKYNPETGEFEAPKSGKQKARGQSAPKVQPQSTPTVDRTPMRTMRRKSKTPIPNGAAIALLVLFAILFIVCICIGTPTANRLGGVFSILLILGVPVVGIMYGS